MKKLFTLCVIHQHSKVLLGMKKRGFGEGRWNGFGGKVEAGETIEESVCRELREEAGIDIQNPQKHGILQFCFKDNPEEILEAHLFRVESFKGEPKESEEMKPAWFHVDEIPFAEMWPDDIIWFPLFLKKKKFKGRFLFEGENTILEQELDEVDNLDL